MADYTGSFPTSGTPGNVLTENAAGVAPSFQPVPTGSASVWVEFLVGTATTSSVSSIPAGSRILRRRLIITTPYSTGATITLDDAGALTILAATQNTPQAANEYQRSDLLIWPGAAAVRALVAGIPPGSGAGLVLVEYVETPSP